MLGFDGVTATDASVFRGGLEIEELQAGIHRSAPPNTKNTPILHTDCIRYIIF